MYDLMEPLRPQIDCLILNFVRSRTFSPSDLLSDLNGVCRLHPQLARQVAAMALSDMVVVQETVEPLVGELRLLRDRVRTE